jgi:selenide, water dikinase
LSADALAQVLRPLGNIFKPGDYPDLLVGLEDPDDAAVWRLDGERALVVTTDFFTPVVDKPYDYGAIAAANSLSDIYAMGGEPFLALNIAAFPPDLPGEIIGEILRGGAEKAREAGVVVAGGHTIQDKEPKYGLIVLGMVHPQRMLTKKGARPGDGLVLSKPLGFGTLTTALKRGIADPTDVSEAVGWMKRLNKDTAQLAIEIGLRAGTDITGFGLLGHAWELASASGVGLRFSFGKVPFIRGAHRYASEWVFPGGSMDNRLYFGPHVRFAAEVDEPSQMLLFDAQTSGGLLLAVPSEVMEDLIRQAAQTGQMLWEIGEVVEGSEIEVVA